jgi:bla regulator protein blaR1
VSTPTWLSNLAAYWLQVAVVVAVGTALAAASRLRVPRVVHAYWQGLLAACLLLPLIQPWQQVATGRVSVSGASLIDLGAGAVASRLPSIPVVKLIALVLITGIILRCAWLGLGFAKLARLRRSARRLEPLPAAMREMRTLLGVEPDFCLSDEISGPVTFGLRQPVILLPVCFLEMDATHQQAIVAHELLHVARRDWAFNLAEEVIIAVFWFHPAVWWLVNRIRLTREQVVDRDAVELTGARKPYLYALAEIAALAGARRLFAAPTFLNESQLAQRTRTLVRKDVMSKRRIVITLAAVVVLMLAAGLAIVRVFPLKAGAAMLPAPADEKTAAKNEKLAKDVTKPVPIYKPEPPYTEEAKDAKLQGTVRLRITIATDGTVSDAKLISHPLGKGLDEQAVETVKTWKFKPATKKGKPVEFKVDVEVTFKFY